MTSPAFVCVSCGRQQFDPIHNTDPQYLAGLPPNEPLAELRHEFVAPDPPAEDPPSEEEPATVEGGDGH